MASILSAATRALLLRTPSAAANVAASAGGVRGAAAPHRTFAALADAIQRQRTSRVGGACATPAPKPELLSPVALSAPPSSAGMKWVGKPQKRCRNCYFEVIDEVKYVFCTQHPRHKQGQKKVRQKFRMTLTHATQGGHRKNGNGQREMWTQQSFRLDY